MWKTILVALATLLVVAPVAGSLPTTNGLSANDVTADSAVASENAAPLADAGLDQEVRRGATVLLDGSGSRDPDGRIERYRWSIHSPSGGTFTPDCTDCTRTEFTPSETGRYRVTLTVTDDDGATRSDTLYVDVSPGAEPSISIAGPRQPTEGTSATYTANLTAGTAALEYVVWTVDGVEIANHSLSATQATDGAAKRFPTAGEQTVTATVYDADGQSATSSLAVSVQRATLPRQPSSSPRSIPSEPERSIASRRHPTVVGKTVVTGTKPLRAQYDVELDAANETVASVEWWNAAGRIGTGRTLVRSWEPGDHQLYALVTYDDGSEDVASFSDGTTTVAADPKPSVSVGSLDRFGAILGTSTATDEYENLDALRVEIDGETVAVAGSSVRGRNRLGFDRQRSVHFSHHEFTPGERASVTVVATDDRGQTTRVRRSVVPVTEPEIVRSEFVNTPVDSYHERIDPSRYVAHHVLEIDLNGVDPENVSVSVKGIGETINLDSEGTQARTSNFREDTLLIDTYWAGISPGKYDTESRYRIENYAWKGGEKDTFKVTPSKPELRLDVLNDGTKRYVTRNHGILVDASGSFDPDGTELKYIWKYGAEPTKPDNTTAKFRAYERAASIVEDQYDLRRKENLDFLAYFVPDVQSATVSTEGPYFPSDTVQIQVQTEAFHFSKQTYYDDFSLGISVSNPEAEVLEWEQVEAPNSAHSDATEDAYRYVATIEIPASELAPGSRRPTITVYNEDNERKKANVAFPDANVLVEDTTRWSNVTLSDLTYTVEKPIVRKVTAESRDDRDEYLDKGYSIESTRDETEYVLEKRVKLQDARYEQITRDFDSPRVREMFLNTQEKWYRAGTRQEEVTRTETNTDWRDADAVESTPKWSDSDLSNGEYTGRSRRVVVEPAVYQTQYQYRYRYHVTKTGTRTITRTRTTTVTRTRTRTVTTCSLRFGCREHTETSTYSTTRTYTYTFTRQYTYTVTRTRTYWAGANLRTPHETTGRTRHVKVEDAVYGTQYEIKYETQYTETVRRYVAARDKMVQPARFEWRETRSTDDLRLARRHIALHDDWRIGETATDSTWVLSKRDGVRRFETSQYGNASHVVQTSATIKGDLVHQYYNVETGEKVTKSVEERTRRETFEGAKDREEIVDEVTESSSNGSECKLKRICGSTRD